MVKLQIFVNGLWFFVGNFVNEVAAWANVADKPGRVMVLTRSFTL